MLWKHSLLWSSLYRDFQAVTFCRKEISWLVKNNHFAFCWLLGFVGDSCHQVQFFCQCCPGLNPSKTLPWHPRAHVIQVDHFRSPELQAPDTKMRLLAPLLVVSVQSPRKNQLNDSLYSQTWLGTHQTASEVASTSYCSRCAQDRALFKQMTKQNIKEEILRKLNFDTAPSWQNVSITQSPVIKNWIKKVGCVHHLICTFSSFFYDILKTYFQVSHSQRWMTSLFFFITNLSVHLKGSSW